MKKVLIGLAVVVVVVVVGVIGFLMTLDFNQYKGLIAEEVKRATGRDLVIAGDIAVGISFTPSLEVAGVTLSNAGWGSRKEMATVGEVEARVALLPLLGNTVDVQKFILRDVDVLLETDSEGRGNWEMGEQKQEQPAEPGEAGGGAPAVVLREIVLENVKLTYKDGVKGETTSVDIASFGARADSTDSPLDFDLAAEFNGAPISVTGQVGALAAAMEGNAPFPVRIAAEAFEAKATVEGSIAKLHEVKGLDLKIGTQVANLTETFAAAQAALPQLMDSGPPPPTGIDLTAQVKDIDGGYQLDGLSFKAGSSDLSGSVTALLGDVPDVTARLTSTNIDTRDFTGPSQDSAAPAEETQAEGGDKKKVFPADPLPLDGMRAVNADVTFQGEKITAGKIVAENVDAAVLLKNGKLTVVRKNTDLYGGKVTGTFVLDGSSGKTAALDANLKVAKLSVGDMMSAVAGQDLIKGAPTDVTVKLKGSGGSVAALMGSLNGNLLVDVGEGVIDNALVDLAGGNLLTNLFPTLTGEKKDTKMSCAVVNAKITNGLAKMENGIALETTEQTIQGDGEINLKTEELEISIRPEATDAVSVDAGGIAKLVKLTGTLAEPGVGIDEKGVAKAAGKAALGVATGGLSIIGEKVLNATGALDDEGSEYPCLTALGKPVPKSQKKQSSSSSSSSSAAAPAKEEEGLGGALKGLFGN